MEKVEVEVRKQEVRSHLFYCDDCNKYLGTSEEYNDGYYKNIGDFELKFYLNGYYKVKKCLCYECKEKYLLKVKKTLNELGFIKE